MWGVIWLIVAIAFFAGGVIVGLVAFKVRSPVTPSPSLPHTCLLFAPVPVRARNLIPFADIVCFPPLQDSAEQQKEDSEHFLPVPGSSGALQLLPTSLSMLVCAAATGAVLLQRRW